MESCVRSFVIPVLLLGNSVLQDPEMVEKDDWAVARRAGAMLVNEAVRRGSADNVSALVVIIRPPSSGATTAEAKEELQTTKQ